MSKTTKLILAMMMVAAAGGLAAAHAQAPYETPPVLKASDLAPPAMLKGRVSRSMRTFPPQIS